MALPTEHAIECDEMQVDVYTAFHDPSRCFKETVDGPFTVKVCGGWFPRAILGKGHAFCAYFRCILVALHIAWAAYRSAQLPPPPSPNPPNQGPWTPETCILSNVQSSISLVG